LRRSAAHTSTIRTSQKATLGGGRGFRYRLVLATILDELQNEKEEKMLALNNKVAVITGGSSGIGLAIATLVCLFNHRFVQRTFMSTLRAMENTCRIRRSIRLVASRRTAAIWADVRVN